MTSANKTHISLETAKLLNGCRVESEFIWVVGDSKKPYIEDTKTALITIEIDKDRNKTKPIFYLAYTWQEILWENADKFLEFPRPDASFILGLLQQKKYEQGDKYFREHCILIK